MFLRRKSNKNKIGIFLVEKCALSGDKKGVSMVHRAMAFKGYSQNLGSISLQDFSFSPVLSCQRVIKHKERFIYIQISHFPYVLPLILGMENCFVFILNATIPLYNIFLISSEKRIL